MAEFIYTMYKARRAVGDKVILDDVTMSFYPGAKIGMVGPNGAGKSTILKIMAGLDQPSNGEARLSPGYSVGILLQEPPLDETKTVLENVQEGMGDLYRKVQRFNAIGEEMALLLPGSALEDAVDVAERVRLAVAAIPLDTRRVTVSIGVSTTDGTCSAELLIEASDRALYASKEGGRNRVTAERATVTAG